MKTKLLALVLVLVLGISAVLVGCSKDNDTTTEPTDTTTNTEVKEVSSKEALQNINFRKALAMSLEKSFISNEILANGSQAVDYLTPGSITPGKDFRSEYPEGFNSYNLDEAMNYWNQAKEELGFEEIEIELLTFDSDSSKKISEYIQAQWQANLPGLSVTINQQPFENKLELASAGNFDVNFAGWGPDYPDPMTYLDLWVTGGGHNNTGMANAEFDAIIDDAKSGELLADADARWAALQEAERMMFEEETAIIPLYQKGKAILQQDYFTGLVEPSFGPDIIFTYAETTQTNENGETIARLVDTSDIPTMDISLATNSVSFQAIGNTNEGLFKYAEDGSIVEGLVKDYSMEEVTNENGNVTYVYTFNLRDDNVWSNGETVTAHDFVYSWRRLGDPNTGAQYAHMLESAGIKNGAAVAGGEVAPEELGVTAADDFTLVVELETNVPFFIELLVFPSFYPQNQAFVEAMGDDYGTSPETALYNGPYTLTKWTLGYEYEYAKNADYYAADEVAIDVVNFRIVKDAAARVNLYEAGDIDRAVLSSEFVSQYVDDSNFKTTEDMSVFYIEMNYAE
ncbi:ABC transporter substrate-binding protein [Vallitalea okinawensis]|uniref:ABC transporter substrate-binding protein n=1 Tax=Vallitalea okinawensis TaxID=2078660 RepID=UPI001478DC61|nr:ABC transporter substrate-binding protein [Vallitalea okinawensis]